MRINATAKTALIQELIFSSHNYFAIMLIESIYHFLFWVL
jgi:hypothetical protein